MLLRIIKTLIYIFVFSAIAFTVVYLLNKSNLDLAQKEPITITSENYTGEVKNSVKYGAIVKITGTPNLLKQVSQESKESNKNDENSVQYYYVALKEYDEDFVVRIKPGKLAANSQTFVGKVIALSSTEFGTRIKNSLNNSIDFDEAQNKEASNELDQESKTLIAENSIGQFENETFLILDEDILSERQVVLGIALWTSVLSLFLITLFRRIVFQLK